MPRTSLYHLGSIAEEGFPSGGTSAGKRLRPVLSSVKNKRVAEHSSGGRFQKHGGESPLVSLGENLPASGRQWFGSSTFFG